MPYIDPGDREVVWDQLKPLLVCIMLDPRPGLLNYLFTVLADAYTQSKKVSYTTLNEVVGVFESAKAEYQRRVVAPYEDQKILENGDVYGITGTTKREPQEIRCEDTKQTWHQCTHPSCDLHLAAPGRIDCSGYCLEDDEEWNQ